MKLSELSNANSMATESLHFCEPAGLHAEPSRANLHGYGATVYRRPTRQAQRRAWRTGRSMCSLLRCSLNEAVTPAKMVDAGLIALGRFTTARG